MSVSVTMRGWLAGVAVLAASGTCLLAQTPADAAQGGAIHGTVVAGTAGKAGGIPLPGVAITATNSLSGKKFTTTTDINGAYAMAIPRNGRYVVRVELAAFAAETSEVLLNAAGENGGKPEQTADFGMQLASRAAAAEARQNIATAGRGLQSLGLSAGNAVDSADASAGTGATGAALPSLAGLGDSAGAATDSVAVSGQTGQTNALGNFSEDEIRQKVEDAVAQGRASGLIPQGGDPTNAIVSALGGLLGGGGRGGGGGGKGGGGGFNFRSFNPAQPHGNVFYQVGNAALNSSSWLQTAPGLPHFTANPAAYSNRFGASIAGSPYIPGLTKPNTKQFVFLNLSGQRNLNPFLQTARVPTVLERTGDFSQSFQRIDGLPAPVTIFNPATGQPYANNQITSGISPQAQALLNLYPAPNLTTSDPTAFNYQTVSNAGSNNTQINARYVRTIGQAGAGPGGRGGGGGRRGAANANTPPALRQNLNAGFSYSHSAQDNRNIFLPLGGASESNGYGLNVGYTIGFGRLSNNSTLNWNRSQSKTRNYFTDTPNNPTAAAGIAIPNQAGQFADPLFYNGVPRLQITNFATLSNQSPSQTINQTISFSDFVSYRHAKHNYRFGFDIRRVHADSIGGNNPLGSFSFTGFATESPHDQMTTESGAAQQTTTGSGFADFLLGLPTQSSLQAGLHKTYLRENVYDGYAQDDFRVFANVTLNYGLRYEYFGPYSEKNNRLVNLDHNADFTAVDPVLPDGTGAFLGKYPHGLVNPDRTLYAPRFGFAYRPKFAGNLLKDTVFRGGYGINYNTGQFATFARNLAFQPPFAATETNTLSTAANPNGCLAVTPTTPTVTSQTLTLANGFGCSGKAIQNDYAVNKDYRLGLVQVFNFNIQRTLPMGIVFNVGYNGSKGSNLDIVRAPNHTANAVTTTNAQAFTYEDSIAGSHLNQLIVSAQKRQFKGVALGATYLYSHSIDNASSIGGSSISTVQDDRRLDLEEGNSSFDVRHKLTGNWVTELPFGPNRAYLNKGGAWSKVLDGFSLSGNFTFSSGLYFTPSFSSSAAQELAGGTFTLRPDRDFTQSIRGTGTLNNFFNKAAFVAPANGFGTASRNSIEGPGTVSTDVSLARTVQLGDTRSFEARVTASNAFNTVQYNGIDTTVNSANYGQVTSAAKTRELLVQARYRF
ncbi:MAG: TonB-dependent receptor [Acidobacteriota bacterium]|nr:TonB-dependent receptor [Acidobacteriota bacterium]